MHTLNYLSNKHINNNGIWSVGDHHNSFKPHHCPL